MKLQQGHWAVFPNMKDTAHCRMVVGGENSAMNQNHKIGKCVCVQSTARLAMSLSQGWRALAFCTSGTQQQGYLRLVWWATTVCLIHRLKQYAVSSPFNNADIVLLLSQGGCKHQETGRQWLFLWCSSLSSTGLVDWTLTHLCFSYHQHHHKIFLQSTHSSVPVPQLPKHSLSSRVSWPQQQQDFASVCTVLWPQSARSAGVDHTIRWVQMLVQISCGPQVLHRAGAFPDWEEDASFYIFSRALS